MSSIHRTTRVSPLVEAMVSGEERSTVGGILVNDVNGLCLISKGNMSTSTTTTSATSATLIAAANASANGDNHDDANSGVYTSLTRLASTLTPYQEASMNNENPPSPLITIEMDGPASILIKEYDGHTIAMKVPSRNAKANATN